MSLPPYDQSIRDLERQYQVVLPDSVGQAALGFRDGVWFRVNSGAPRPVPLRSAIILCPHAAGSIVQIACWWMRENARTSRALDLATELALTVGELARKAIEDDPLGMSLDGLGSSSGSSGASSLLGLSQGGGYQTAAATGGYASGSFAAAGAPAPAPSYDSGSYAAAPAYQGTNDPYAAPYPAPGVPQMPASAAATTVLPSIPADGYGMPPAPRGPAVPPRGAGMGGGPGGPGQPPLGSGGYPQRPAPLSGQPIRPQQGGRYPQPQQGGGRPQQGRPMPRPADRYEEEPYRGGDLAGRPPTRPSARPEPGSAW
ncbi:hypothetical protein KDL01_00025 [Actinospica durhamensis]|uniref:Uncharacterized protein n=1 Tax=Actinospica durhamensis TaxID=1508375 RepID=A0A941EIV5_9ACTN|nr:hypothetical protein [Actinospica durhamensis]MBR7831623.1 hypothetical protein [Actinospica durhamensis]